MTSFIASRAAAPARVLVRVLGRARRACIVLRHAHRARALPARHPRVRAGGRRQRDDAVPRGGVPRAILGGTIADRWLGRFGTIAAFALPYVAGHVVLAAVPTRAGLGIALVLAGARLGRDQAQHQHADGHDLRGREEDGAARPRVQLLLRRDQRRLGADLTRPAAGPRGVRLRDRARGAGGADGGELRAVRRGPPHTTRPNPPRPAPTAAERTPARASIRKLAPLFGLVAVFWFVYDQSASTWIFFARDFADLDLGGSLSITPDQIQGTNPVFILLLTPIFKPAVGLASGTRRGREVPETLRMRYGGSGSWSWRWRAWRRPARFAASGKVSAWWLLLATFVITLAELCISVVWAGAGLPPRAARHPERRDRGVPRHDVRR